MAARRAVRRAGRSAPATQAAALGPGAFFPFAYAEAKADEIDLCLHWPEASARAGRRRRLPEGPGVGPPGRRGPAHAAGRLGARGGRARARSGSSCPGSGTRSWAATRRAAGSGGCSRSCAAGRPPRPARGCRREVPATGVPPTALSQLAPRGRAARARGADGGGARRDARRPDLRALAGRSARRCRAPGCGAGASACAGGRSCWRACRWSRACASAARCRGAGARACGSPAPARPAAGCGSRRRAWCAGGSAGGACAGGCGRGRRGRSRAVREAWRRRHDSGTGRRCLLSDAPPSLPSLPLRMRSTPR